MHIKKSAKWVYILRSIFHYMYTVYFSWSITYFGYDYEMMSLIYIFTFILHIFCKVTLRLIVKLIFMVSSQKVTLYKCEYLSNYTYQTTKIKENSWWTIKDLFRNIQKRYSQRFWFYNRFPKASLCSLWAASETRHTNRSSS